MAGVLQEIDLILNQVKAKQAASDAEKAGADVGTSLEKGMQGAGQRLLNFFKGAGRGSPRPLPSGRSRTSSRIPSGNRDHLRAGLAQSREGAR